MSEVSDIVKEESTRQFVIFLFALATVVGTAIVIEKDSVDNWRSIKMSSALTVKHFCQHEADRWQRWADNAATRYNREKA